MSFALDQLFLPALFVITSCGAFLFWKFHRSTMSTKQTKKKSKQEAEKPESPVKLAKSTVAKTTVSTPQPASEPVESGASSVASASQIASGKNAPPPSKPKRKTKEKVTVASKLEKASKTVAPDETSDQAGKSFEQKLEPMKSAPLLEQKQPKSTSEVQKNPSSSVKMPVPDKSEVLEKTQEKVDTTKKVDKQEVPVQVARTKAASSAKPDGNTTVTTKPKIDPKPIDPIIPSQNNSRQLTSSLKMGSQSDNKDITKDQIVCNGQSFKQHQVRVLTLHHGQHLQDTLFRLQKGYILQLRPGPSLFGKKTNIFTNYPLDYTQEFIRNKFRRLDWQDDSCSAGDDTAFYVEMVMQKAGSFYFYLTYDDDKEIDNAQASGYFIVDPVLRRGKNQEVLPLDGIQCQTYLSKCLGSLDRWLPTLQVARESGYNMIHFTPIQELGGSRSGYSLRHQLKLNPDFSPPGKNYTIQDVESLVKTMEQDWNVLSLTDIVLNHTANESEWIKEHTECSYNLINSPHLRPAYIIDRAIYHLALEIIGGEWEHRGIPKALTEEYQVKALESILYDEVLVKPRVEEFFLVDVDVVVKQFHAKITQKRRPSLKGPMPTGVVDIIQDPDFNRFSCTIDMDEAMMKFNEAWADCSEETRIRRCLENFRRHVEFLNTQKRNEVAGHLRQAVGCILGTVRYERLQWDGPKIKEVSKKHPLVPCYFTHDGPDTNLEEEEKLSFSEDCQYIMAHNGWVMGDDPLRNFAAPGSDIYLRRELNAWGDSIKLRFGDGPEDCPYLWDFMRKYVEETARVFHGIRLDNCHSTPIHVAEYLLDCARKVRPDLYVIAELFTSSDKTDNVFVNKLGINSLIREAMSAPNSHEEGRLVYRYGGEPVGAFIQPPVRPLVPSIAHAIFLDITHDNRSPCEIRTAWDMLPTTALVNMASCASGSTRGYDEIVPHHIHVVTEERFYPKWSDKDKLEAGETNLKTGIISCKKILNDLHCELAQKQYTQVFVDQVTEHIVTVTRHNPVTHESVVLVAFTSFVPPSHIQSTYTRPLKVQGKLEKILFELAVRGKFPGDENKKVPGEFTKDPKYINGCDSFDVEIRENLQPDDSSFVKQISPKGADTTEFEYTENFKPGSVVAFKLSLLSPAQEAVNKIRSILDGFKYKERISDVSSDNKELIESIKNLSLSDLNRVLYRCEQEENDEGRGWGSYAVPQTGPFVYCGIQGIISVLADIRLHNDLGHPLCGNLRDGNWLMDYIAGRLKLEKPSEKLANWLQDKFDQIATIPRYLIPAYFDAMITSVYLCLINHAWNNMSKFVAEGSDFAKALSLCSVQFCGHVRSALLPKLSPNLASPKPPVTDNVQSCVTISAGLPHFSIGYMRNWGRDTFIALPGNLLITGRFDEARWVILGFAATLRHGLIPNLLDGGANSRFNCRDATWFWLYSIQQYVDTVPNGHNLLKDTVSRLFPEDDSEPQPAGKYDQPLENIIHEALQRHFRGEKFRERNAGPRIDSQMVDQGFNNEIGINRETGFPFGGNENNCGTWMDKMGSSAKAGNKGKPSSPRDGSAVEIVGLCKAALRFLNRMYAEGKYSFNKVQGADDEWTYEFWEQRIQESFEKHFWINSTPTQNECRPDLINQRGIYKDSVGATQSWADYQLRCNFPIAIAIAPEIVTASNAQIALEKAEKVLLGPLGIKTLDPSDWAYRGDYDNSNDSEDPSVAHGSNYHQGPEWVWPVGWFLRAKLAIAQKLGVDETKKVLQHIKSLLAPRFSHLLSSPWKSLPELTNSNGSYCRDSNPAQSWSTGCLLEVLSEMNTVERRLQTSAL